MLLRAGNALFEIRNGFKEPLAQGDFWRPTKLIHCAADFGLSLLWRRTSFVRQHMNQRKAELDTTRGFRISGIWYWRRKPRGGAPL